MADMAGHGKDRNGRERKPGYHLVFRQITRATNQRTAIACILPGDIGIGASASVIELPGWGIPVVIEQQQEPEPELFR